MRGYLWCRWGGGVIGKNIWNDFLQSDDCLSYLIIVCIFLDSVSEKYFEEITILVIFK